MSGYDPYNNPGREQRELIAAMERIWRECISQPSGPPSMILLTADASEMLQGRRSVTFYPYGTPRNPIVDWWKPRRG